VIKKPSEIRKGFISSELASNMLNTFLNTNADDCNQMSITELLQDCAKAPDAGGVVKCSDDLQQKSCGFVQSKVESIFGQTLGLWGVKYIFQAFFNLNNPTLLFESVSNFDSSYKCLEKKSKLFPIPVEASTITMYVKLDICQ
jgi:hypothetical protein